METLRHASIVTLSALCLAGCDPAAGDDPDGSVDSDADTSVDSGADTSVDRDADEVPGDSGGDTIDPPLPDADLPPEGDGCGRAVAPGDSVSSLSHDGRERTFRLHVPAGYDPARPTPVVLNFHGRNSTAQQQITVSRMVALADAEGFIAVHPEGVGQTWNGGLCCGVAMDEGVDDVGFTAAILDRLDSELCVDSHRVYATGLSNGGFMSHRLACDLADRIAAVGPVAGPNGVVGCSPSRPVPVFHFHGTADTVVPFEGFAGYLAVPDTMQGWVDRNGCGATSSVFFEEEEVRCEEWSGCTGGATVRLCTIDGGGHQWPGGMTIPMLGYNTSVISASQMMWDFFEAHPLP